MRVGPIAAIVARRDARVLARTVVGIAVAFVASIVVPAALLVVSPVLLGVVHVGADVRYLVRREGFTRRAEALFCGGCAALLALRGAEMVVPTALPYARVELCAAAAWIAAAAFFAAGDGAARARAAGVALVVAGLVALGWPRPDLFRIVFAHAHNVVAVVLWAALFFRWRRASLIPMALIAVALFVILRGATLPYVVHFGGYAAFGGDIFAAATELAPHVTGALGPSIALSYVFLQAVHYMAWLVWIPESATRTQGTLTFRMTLKGLDRDLGRVWLSVIAFSAIAVVVAALFDAARARAAYLSLAAFHGYLELAAVAYLATRLARERPDPAAQLWSTSG